MTGENFFKTHIAYGLPYWLHLPEGYDPDSEQTWPLILFLHGAGERGVDFDLLKSQGLPKKLQNQPDFPFVVAAPQCPENRDWTFYNDVLIALLNRVIVDHRVDESRVYLTGLSMGGRGVWLLASEFPERFAAIAPICGRVPGVTGFMGRLGSLKDMPVWVFHGDADDIIPVTESDRLVEGLKALGKDVRYTVYAGVKHDSWTQTYDDPELYAWLLQHRIRA